MRSLLATLTLAGSSAWLAGCGGTNSDTHNTASGRHYEVQFTLSHELPSSTYGFRLLEVEENGDVTIGIFDTGEILTAAPTEFYDSPKFGSQGLKLVESSHQLFTATFARRLPAGSATDNSDAP